MAVKKLPDTYPTVPLREPRNQEEIKGVDDLFSSMRSFERQLSQLKDLITEAINDHATVINAGITSGTSNPSTTPASLGLIFVNTTADTVWMSKGTESSADWVQVSN
jgi:hypothetical protein